MNKPNFNHGLRGFSPNGGNCTLKNFGAAIGGDARSLTKVEFDAFQKAKLLAHPDNGSRWDRARESLEDAGFEVLVV